MAGKTIDMSRIKQLLQLKKLGLSNRQIAKELKISRDKTNEYVRMAELDSLDIDALLGLDDPVLSMTPGKSSSWTSPETLLAMWMWRPVN